MTCLFGLEESFSKATRLLEESVGWTISPDKLRRLCHAEADRLRKVRPPMAPTADRFANASGDWEMQIDAGKVNTTEGWHDVKVATLARRGRAQPSDSTDYEQRDLPAPCVHVTIVEIESAERFGERCQAESIRLKRPALEPFSVLGDGAEWIGNLSERRFAGAEQVLDICHAVEYLSDLARAGFGADQGSSAAWPARIRRALVADGWAGVCQFMALETARVADVARLQAACPAVANYLAGHEGRLNSAARLHRGQPIGSGLIEGTIKQQITLRMKQSGARWDAAHVGPFVELPALVDTPEWQSYWNSQTSRPN